MSTEILHFGAYERKAVMLEKLGGQDALRQAIDTFYAKQLADDRLMRFFHGVNVEIIKWHQFNLMSIAFTAIPDKHLDVKQLLLTRHRRLFDEGLSEDQFDMVMTHFTDTLNEMNVDATLMKEAVDVVMPLRDVFAQGARESRERNEAYQRKRRAVLVVLAAAVAITAVKLIKSKKK